MEDLSIMFCHIYKESKKMRLRAFGECNLKDLSRTLKPAMGRWQDPVTLFLVREVRIVRVV